MVSTPLLALLYGFILLTAAVAVFLEDLLSSFISLSVMGDLQGDGLRPSHVPPTCPHPAIINSGLVTSSAGRLQPTRRPPAPLNRAPNVPRVSVAHSSPCLRSAGGPSFQASSPWQPAAPVKARPILSATLRIRRHYRGRSHPAGLQRAFDTLGRLQSLRRRSECPSSFPADGSPFSVRLSFT